MNRAIKRILLDVVPLGGELARRAQALLDEPKAKRRRMLSKSAPRRAKEKETKEQRRDRIAIVRAEVFRLAGGLCEASPSGQPAVATELHHVLSGSDRRRLEATDNCVALCRDCHEDMGTIDGLRSLLPIARLSTEARRAIQRRIDKIRSRTP